MFTPTADFLFLTLKSWVYSCTHPAYIHFHSLWQNPHHKGKKTQTIVFTSQKFHLWLVISQILFSHLWEKPSNLSEFVQFLTNPMDGKKESLGTDGNSFLGLNGHHVCNGEPPGKAGTFLMVWRRLKLIKKIVHFSVSELMLNSDHMVSLHLNIKSFALDFYRITVIQISFITILKSQQHILNLKYKNCWKPSWSSEIILTNITEIEGWCWCFRFL